MKIITYIDDPSRHCCELCYRHAECCEECGTTDEWCADDKCGCHVAAITSTGETVTANEAVNKLKKLFNIA